MSRGVKNKKNNKLGWIALVGLLLVAVLGFLPTVDRAVQAQADNQLRGWSWSDNIGWISFNSSNANSGGSTYSVVLNADEALEGYAWSSNIGYIRFDSAYTGVAGQGDNHGAKIVGNTLTGWARACAVFVSGCAGTLRSSTENGGWDGWIKMTNVTVTTQANNSRKLGGFAWGDFNLGWVSFAWSDLGGGGGGSGCEGPDCGVIIPPGGGPIVSCTVVPAEGVNTYYFNGSGGTTYNWYINNESEGSGSPFEKYFGEIGTYVVKMQAYNDEGAPIGSEPINCTDGIINVTEIPEEEAVCEIKFNTSKVIKYYNDNDANYDPDNKAKVIFTNCDSGSLSLQEDGRLNPQFELVCADTNSAGSTFRPCNNLIANSEYWIWVKPTNGLPTNPIVKNRFGLILYQPDEEGVSTEAARANIRFDYSIIGNI